MAENGVSKKLHVTETVFVGLLGAMVAAETSSERLWICGIIGACFVLYMSIQGYIDIKRKDK